MLIVDDHPLCIFALTHILSPLFDSAHIVTAPSAEEGLLAARKQDLTLIVLDVFLPGIDGIEAIKQFRKIIPDALIAIISSSEDRRDIAAALRAGAQIFISKSAYATAILAAVTRVLRREPNAPRVVLPGAQSMQLQSALPELTVRQAKILGLLAKGKSNREIGAALSLAEPTVKMHISALFRVLAVANRTQAVLMARRYSLLSE